MFNRIMGWIGIAVFGMMALIMMTALINGIWNGISAPISDWIECVIGAAVGLTGVYVSFDETRK